MVTCTTPPFRAAVRLNSGVRPVQKQMPVNKHQAKLALVLALPWLLILATNSVPARAPAVRFWVRLARKERLSALDSGQVRSLVKSTAGTGLTIRSSRARFAASCKFLQVSLAQGRKSARLNSGVRPLTKNRATHGKVHQVRRLFGERLSDRQGGK